MAKRKRTKRRKCFRSCVIGKGKFWDGVKNFLKKTKVLSTAASLIPGVCPALGNVVSNVGCGRKRRRGGKTNWLEIVKKFGKNHNKLLNIKLGGRRRRKRKSRSRKGHSSNNYDNRYIDNKIRAL